MNHLNIEIKAKCSNPDKIRKILEDKSAVFKGIDHQIDTYFKVQKGRLKLREGNIENNLIYYERIDQAGPKQSDIILMKTEAKSAIKQILERIFGILVIVDKRRGIYFIDNVKFHIDEVKGLGSFMEIEAIDETGKCGKEKLDEQCNYYMNLFGIKKEDLLTNSYSDMLMKKKK